MTRSPRQTASTTSQSLKKTKSGCAQLGPTRSTIKAKPLLVLNFYNVYHSVRLVFYSFVSLCFKCPAVRRGTARPDQDLQFPVSGKQHETISISCRAEPQQIAGRRAVAWSPAGMDTLHTASYLSVGYLRIEK